MRLQFLIILAVLLLATNIYALGQTDNYVNLDVSLLNQEPYPASAGQTVDLAFKIENLGISNLENLELEIVPEYPLSLDPGETSVKNLGDMLGLNNGLTEDGWKREPYYARYKLRVDEQALDGDYEIKLKYRFKITNFNEIDIEQSFFISINSTKTDFDVILQDVVGNAVTLAVLNTGKYTAYSIVVDVPKQEDFETNGITQTVIGNLERGDYAFSEFNIFPKKDQADLEVSLSYTDANGARKSIKKLVPISNIETQEQVAKAVEEKQSSGKFRGITYIVIGIVGLVAIVILFRILSRKHKLKIR